jgi:preprotein translocase subunit SecB
MRQSPLIIDFYFVKKVQFELRNGFDTDFHEERKEVDPPKLNINVESGKHSEEPNRWRFELSIEADENSSEPDFPYTFFISLVGFFRVDENYPAENADMLALVNAPSLLYSAAREFLANVTGRSPYPAILLPSVSFFPEPEKPQRKKVSSPKGKKKTTDNTKKK